MARISLETWLEDEGYSSAEEAILDLQEFNPDLAVVPALCDQMCSTEPDGHCPHGGPSLLIAAGLI